MVWVFFVCLFVLKRTASRSEIPFLALPGRLMGFSDGGCQRGSVRYSALPTRWLEPGSSLPQAFPGPPLPRPHSSKLLCLPLTPDKRPRAGGSVTSWIKYLGCHGVRRFSRFRSSTRCFSSRRRFCSVAASMSPSRRYWVTSRHRFLGTHGGEETGQVQPAGLRLAALSGEGGSWADHL